MDRNLLANATSSDDTPTPGYMLNEIASKICIEILFYLSLSSRFHRMYVVQLSSKCPNSRISRCKTSKK